MVAAKGICGVRVRHVMLDVSYIELGEIRLIEVGFLMDGHDDTFWLCTSNMMQ